MSNKDKQIHKLKNALRHKDGVIQKLQHNLRHVDEYISKATYKANEELQEKTEAFNKRHRQEFEYFVKSMANMTVAEFKELQAEIIEQNPSFVMTAEELEADAKIGRKQ